MVKNTMNLDTRAGEVRRQRHLEARSFVVGNQLETAVEKFRSTIAELGPHVGLLCDLSGCYYELGRFTEFEQSVSTIARDYNRVEGILSTGSKRRTALMLAKFYEELAEPAVAIEWLNRAQQVSEDLEERKWVFANELRLLSYFGFKNGLQRKYLALLEMHRQDASLHVETLHALMWAEWALFGYNHAIRRWHAILELELNALDRRLIARDFVEISLLAVNRRADLVDHAIQILRASDALEIDRILIQMAGSSHVYLPDVDTTKLPLMMRLRLLILSARLAADPDTNFEIAKKFSFLVGALSAESRKLFKQIEPVVNGSRHLEIDVYVSDKKASLPRYELVSRLTSLQAQFLQVMAGKTFLSIDDVAALLWREEGTESTYHRLRMLIYKLNAMFAATTGLQAFEIKKDGVKAHSELRLKIY